MRLLHFADLHLGIERYGQIDPASGLSTRLLDFLRAFDAIVGAAIEERVDAVLFAGDAFKTRDPSPTVQREFARRIRRLAEARIPVVLLVGNHDLPSAWGRATAIEIYQALAVPGVHIADTIGTLRLDTADGPLQVTHLPWITRSHLVGQEALRDATMEQVQEQMHEAITGLLAQEAAALDPTLPAVLLAHGSVSGATYGSERSALLSGEIVFTRSDLSAAAFDYVALGHIHKHQAVGAHPPLVYPGSPERVDFGEEREEKGYVLVELRPGPEGGRVADWQFRPLPARPFRTLRLRAFGSDPQGDLLRVIERATDLDGAIVRLHVDLAPEAEGQVRALELRRGLRAAGAAHVAGISLEAEQPATRARLALDPARALDPLQMLDLYLAAREVPAARAARLRELAATLLPTTEPPS